MKERKWSLEMLKTNVYLDVEEGKRILGSRYEFDELGWFGSGYGLLESSCECGIEPPGP